MGCAPSIHVSHNTDVVYNDVSHQIPPRRASISISEVVQYTGVHRESISTEVRITHIQTTSGPSNNNTGKEVVVVPKEKKEVLSKEKKELLPKELQVSKEKKVQHIDVMPLISDEMTATKCELQLGPMKISKQPMEIMLVFENEDAQASALLNAAKRGSYKCTLCTTPETAMEHYLKHFPELLVIDARTTNTLDGHALCRDIRSSRPNVNTVIVAVLKKSEQEENSIAPLLKTGFSRAFTEDHNVVSCLNELLMLDHTEVSAQCKLRATSCLFSAAEHAYDSIEIQCVDPDKAEFQYANPAYEKVTGFWRSEVNKNILANCDIPKPELHDSITKLLRNGKSWEGVCIARKKSGEQFVQNLNIVPMIGHAGRVTHYLVVKRDLTALERDTHIQEMHQQLNKLKNANNAETANCTTNIHTSPVEAVSSESVTLSNSVSVKAEAPITKVINMLNAVQENSPPKLVQVLERVIDILRRTELYTPATLEQVEGGEGFGSDLVEGLMWNFRERRHSGDSCVKGNYHQQPLDPQKVFQVSQASPDVQAALAGDDRWDYDVINLERVTNKRPLYYLGQSIFNRFNVAEYLSVSESIIRNWLQLVEANYHAHNTYHNSTHAADVLHASAVFLLKDEVKNTLDRSDQVASLIAAVVHDVDHPGFTNSFLCNAGSDLAILYNDIAVLESHHAAMAFKLTSRDPKSNIFQNISQDEFKLLRQSIIDMVMATEMKQHFEHLAKFDNSFNKRHISLHEQDPANNGGRGTPESVSPAHLNLQSPENRAVVRRMIIKCADIANPARPISLCKEWAFRIAEEYFTQTEEEKRRNLPIVMPVFERSTCNVPKSQIFFIDYFVMNLYEAWDKFAQVSDAMDFLRQNYAYWSAEAERQESGKEADDSS